MFKDYIKTKKTKALRYKDDYETYKFIAKTLGLVIMSESEYHNNKKFGLNLKCSESRQVLFIGDYLACGDEPGDFYVIRKDFMENNYTLYKETTCDTENCDMDLENLNEDDIIAGVEAIFKHKGMV